MKNGEYFFTTDKYAYLKQWSVKTHNKIMEYGHVHDGGIKAVAFSWDEK